MERGLFIEPRASLVYALREHLDLTGVKKGCDQVTGWVDGRRVLACLTLAITCEGHDATTSSNPLGVKGDGEIGRVGAAAAIANAVFHATGRRVCELPIRIEYLL